MRRSAAPSFRQGVGYSKPVGEGTTPCLPSLRKDPEIKKVLQPTQPSPVLKDSCSTGTPVARSTASILHLLKRASTPTDPTESHYQESNEGRLPTVPSATPTCSNTPVPSTQSSSSKSIPSVLQEKRIYNVVFGKQSTRKHKVWEGDGTLELGEKTAVLKDADGKILGRATQVKTAELDEGSRLKVGSKEVELIDLISGAAPQAVSNTGSNKRPAEEATDTSGQTTCKRPKAKILKKKFTGFSTEASEPLILPTPSHDHQWNFNQNQREVTPVSVDSFLTRVLRPHQREGVVFLYECVLCMRNSKYSGAILADEMGLGKTLQTITLVWTLLRQGPYGGIPFARRVLVVSPSSLVSNWQKEFERWVGKHRLVTFAVDQKNKIAEFVRFSHIPVMLVSYEMLVRKFDEISGINFDLLVCDEGHRLKNTNIRTSVLLSQLTVKARVLLTGTPIQNDLQEFYALVNFINPGILGSPAEFRKQYEEPIVASRQPQCSSEMYELGQEKAVELNSRTSCFILRRTQAIINKYLPTKTESVLFIKPTQIQQTLFRAALDWWENRDRSPGMSDGSIHLGVITALKKICNHPALIRSHDGTKCDESNDEALPQDGLLEELTNLYNTHEGGVVAVHHSGKMNVVRRLLERLVCLKERVVLVSYYTQTLDVLAALCDELRLPYCRLDGTTPTAQRSQIVDQFNGSFSKHFVFLLSARAGGVGLNLTGASRLLLFDSDWNPATDAQAMSRVWRDGQKHSVYIYRLLTCGSIEEKIFQRQLSKTGLSGTVVAPNSSNSIRLSSAELKDIFTFHSGNESLTHKSLGCDCDGRGGVPLPEDLPGINSNKENKSEEDNRDCQLQIGPSQSKLNDRADLRMNELFSWQHHGPPFSQDILEGLGLSAASNELAFMFIAPPSVDKAE